MAEKMQKIKTHAYYSPNLLILLKFLSYKPLNTSHKSKKNNLIVLRRLFHRSKGCVCLESYIDVVAKHIDSTVMQLHSSPSNRIAAGSPQNYFLF